MNRKLRDVLKHNLVPTEENNFHPRFFHVEIFSIFLILVVALQIFVYSGTATRIISAFPAFSNIAAVLPAMLAAETNQYRLAQNTTPLKNSELLTVAAELKAQDMLKRGYFSHVDPDGNMPWKWFEQVGYQYSYAGENLAVDFVDSKDVTEAWIHSLTHRANLVNKDFSEIGIGTAQGVFEGKNTTFVVQFLAKPVNRASVPVALTATTPKRATSTLAIAKIVTATSSFTTTTTTTSSLVATTSLATNGQVLGLDSTIGEVFYSSKQVSRATILILVILIICILLLSVTYSITHHSAPRIIDKIKITLTSHKKVFVYSCIFIFTLCIILVIFVSLKSTVRI